MPTGPPRLDGTRNPTTVKNTIAITAVSAISTAIRRTNRPPVTRRPPLRSIALWRQEVLSIYPDTVDARIKPTPPPLKAGDRIRRRQSTGTHRRRAHHGPLTQAQHNRYNQQDEHHCHHGNALSAHLGNQHVYGNDTVDAGNTC